MRLSDQNPRGWSATCRAVEAMDLLQRINLAFVPPLERQTPSEGSRKWQLDAQTLSACDRSEEPPAPSLRVDDQSWVDLEVGNSSNASTKPCTTRNAIKLLTLAGFPQDVTNLAETFSQAAGQRTL